MVADMRTVWRSFGSLPMIMRMAGMKPRLAYRVDNKITDDDSKMAVELRFKSLDDFHPERVAEQVTPVRKLVEARKRLSDLLSKLDGNDKLDELLQDVLASTDSIEKLGEERAVLLAGKSERLTVAVVDRAARGWQRHGLRCLALHLLLPAATLDDRGRRCGLRPGRRYRSD